MVVRAALAALLVLTAAQAAGPRVECLRVGRGSVEGELVAIASGKVAIEEKGQRSTHVLNEFREVVFASPARTPAAPPLTLWRAGGGRMAAEKVASAGAEALDVDGRGWQGRGVPLASVRALAARDWLAGARAAEREAFERARTEPPAGHDLLMVVREDRRQSVPCIVDRLGADGVTVQAAGRSLTVPWTAVGWLVLSPAGAPPPDKPAHLVMLSDGTTLPAASLALSDGKLTATDGAAIYTVDADRLARIRVASDAYVYLSDLKPARVEQTPFVDVAWPPRMDRAVSGGPLTLAGRTYPKGIGMYGGTRVTFHLPAGYSKLYATIGVDDAAGAPGRVTFRVLLDGKKAFEAGPLAGGVAPIPVVVDLKGARELTLEAAFGSEVDASGELADWAGARLTE